MPSDEAHMTVVHYGTHPDPVALFTEIVGFIYSDMAVDVETYSVDDITLLGIGISVDSADGFYVTPDDAMFESIVWLLQEPTISKIYHNAPFDMRVLRDYEIDVDNVDDTAMMARLYPEPSAVLENCSFWVGQQTESMKRLFEKHSVSKVINLPFEVLAEKCCRDAMATRALYDYYTERIDMDYYNWLRPMFGILNHISRQGIRLDPDRIEELDTFYGKRIMQYRQYCQDIGFSPSSPKQVGYILASRGNWLPLTNRGRGKQLMSDDEHLMKMTDPVAHLVLEFRHAQKMESTYVRPFKNKARAYTTLMMEAGTGRVNSRGAGKEQPDRNLQNIPKNAERRSDDVSSVRSAFIPDLGLFTKMDMSQAELRILAWLAQDVEMMALFARDEDIHGWVETATGLSRVLCKNLNFGIMYGGDVETIATFLHMSDLSKVQTILDMYKEMFPQVWQWLLDQEQLGLDTGMAHTLGGRPLRLPTIQGAKHMANCARNYPIQGTAFEAMTRVMLDPTILQHLDITRLQIHDELIFDGDVHIEDMKYDSVKSLKENCPTYTVRDRLAWLSGFYLPLEVQKVERWG